MKQIVKRIGHQVNLMMHPRPRTVLFDHLPKCGGTSVNNYLQSQYPGKRVFSLLGHNAMSTIGEFIALPEEERHGYGLIIGHEAHQLIPWANPDKLTLTIFRDPVDRIISHYFYARESEPHYLHKAIVENNLTIKDYLKLEQTIELRNWYVAHLLQPPLEEAETADEYDAKIKIIAREAETDPEGSVDQAFETLTSNYDVIGLLDSMGDSLNELAKLARFHKLYERIVVNKTKNRKPREEIDDSTLEAIAEQNWMDVELYRRIKEHQSSPSAPVAVTAEA